jgi:hypothetical protein
VAIFMTMRTFQIWNWIKSSILPYIPRSRGGKVVFYCFSHILCGWIESGFRWVKMKPDAVLVLLGTTPISTVGRPARSQVIGDWTLLQESHKTHKHSAGKIQFLRLLLLTHFTCKSYTSSVYKWLPNAIPN